MKYRLLFILVVLTATAFGQTQSPYSKFGKIPASDLQKTEYSIDPGAAAVVLSDVGDISFEGNSKGWFSSVLKRHRVVHVLKKEGFSHAMLEIPVYNSAAGEEKIEGFRAAVYHLKSGRVSETRLDKSAIVKEQIDNSLALYRIIIPAVQPGCIVEIEYKVISDFYREIRPWYFQEECPVLWSEYRFNMPQFFSFRFYPSGFFPFLLETAKDFRMQFILTEAKQSSLTTNADMERNRFEATVAAHRWVARDLPAVIADPFLPSAKDPLQKIMTRFISHKAPFDEDILQVEWKDVAKMMLEDPGLGKALAGSAAVMPAELNAMLRMAADERERARAVHAWIRDNINCTDHEGIYALNPLATVLKLKRGNVAEINLLLTAFLRQAGMEAYPVLVSRHFNGRIHADLPGQEEFNYLLTEFRMGERRYYLDAAHKGLGFGMLLPDCLNGAALVIDSAANIISLEPAMQPEKRHTRVQLRKNNTGWTGSVSHVFGNTEAMMMRQQPTAADSAFFDKMIRYSGTDMTIAEGTIQNLADTEKPMVAEFRAEINCNELDSLYFKPLLAFARRQNPFTAEKRLFPVQLPYAFEEIFEAEIELPAGYRVEKLPSTVTLVMGKDGDGIFEFRVSREGDMIHVYSKTLLNKSFFAPSEYQELKDFYGKVVKSHDEAILFVR